MALACGPDLLIADEPTTALDVTIQQQILDLISELVAERGMALMLISHDLGVIAQNVHRMLVMYGGSVVESGPTDTGVPAACTPTRAACSAPGPGLDAPRGQRLATIAGTVPELVDLPAGCPFAGRCSFTVDACHAHAPAARWNWAMSTPFAAASWRPWPPPAGGRMTTPLLQVHNLVREYHDAARAPAGPAAHCQALNGVSFTIEAGRSLGIVGESGSGKSTLARLVMALDKPTGQRASCWAAICTRCLTPNCARAARLPDGVPGPVRLAGPAPDGGAHRHRAAAAQGTMPSRAERASAPRGAGIGGPARQPTSTNTRTSFPAASASALRSPAP
jgi:oligopeptide/dipeptide ABC transporter ATP-binding protein